MEKYSFSAHEKSWLEGLRQPFAVYQFLNKRVVTLAISDGFCKLFGYSDRDRAYFDMDHDMYKDTHPDDVARIANAAIRFATEGGRYEVVYRTRIPGTPSYRVVHAMGEHVFTDTGVRLAHVWYTDEGAYLDGSDGEASGINCALSNALSSALHEESILKASQYDYLTGLPSMTYFFELADAAKAAILKEGGHPVLMYMDFSGMKFYNTKHGFAEGDNLLRAFARILIQTFNSENCCHIGADHFAVVACEEGLEDKLRQMFLECQQKSDGQFPPIHVGIYPSRLENVYVSVACDRAKLACSALRGTYASGFNYYNSELNDDAEKKQYIIENIDRAIREKWIQVYYQPIVRAVNEKVCDEEALARWIDPVAGFLSPGQFIPYLEDAGLIYKLDLYVLDQVLEKMLRQSRTELHIVPHSINLSRSDFDACDIVEEIRKRVDAAGIARDRITIEITESIIGSDFDFMKNQIARFQALGFPVWMDDFGSGYSSLDVLQSIKFDLLKFDMSFMRKLDEGDSGKIILTELMKMATTLGVDTVCEGVETADQAHFLQEIGCSKLQGFYYCKAIPLEGIIERNRKGIQIGYENPDESSYFESIGRVNLYDLAVLGTEDEGSLQNAFSTLPMGIIEINGDTTRFVRSNQSYRDFIRRFFKVNLSHEGSHFTKYTASFLHNIVKTCCERGIRTFYDEKMPDGSVVHSFARRIDINPVTGSIAVAIAVLSISEPDEGATYADIARALAADYYNIYIVDLDTERFIEYTSPAGIDELAMERHGTDFFETARRDTMTRIYEEDRAAFLDRFTKKNIVHELDAQGVFTDTYRMIDSGTPQYVSMKIMRMQPGGSRIIIGISIVDAQMKQKELDDIARQERIAFGRIAALSGNYIVMYSVDPETGRYLEYSASREFEHYGLPKEGEDFFEKLLTEAPRAVDPADLPMYLKAVTRENMMGEIERRGLFAANYRLMLSGRSRPVSLRAALVQEADGNKLIVGINIVEERGL